MELPTSSPPPAYSLFCRALSTFSSALTNTTTYTHILLLVHLKVFAASVMTSFCLPLSSGYVECSPFLELYLFLDCLLFCLSSVVTLSIPPSGFKYHPHTYDFRPEQPGLPLLEPVLKSEFLPSFPCLPHASCIFLLSTFYTIPLFSSIRNTRLFESTHPKRAKWLSLLERIVIFLL